MTRPDATIREGLTAHPHYVALPYRADGVARALCEIYPAVDDTIPSDMLQMLSAIDRLLAANARR